MVSPITMPLCPYAPMPLCPYAPMPLCPYAPTGPPMPTGRLPVGARRRAHFSFSQRATLTPSDRVTGHVV